MLQNDNSKQATKENESTVAEKAQVVVQYYCLKAYHNPRKYITVSTYCTCTIYVHQADWSGWGRSKPRRIEAEGKPHNPRQRERCIRPMHLWSKCVRFRVNSLLNAVCRCFLYDRHLCTDVFRQNIAVVT